jgi:hypothetical protein
VRRFHHQHVEVGHVAPLEPPDVIGVGARVAITQVEALQPVQRERAEYRGVKPRRLTEARENGALVVVVSDAETPFKSFVLTMLPKEFGAERVDGSALHEVRGFPKVVQSRPDLLGGLVGERESLDPRRVDALPSNQEPNALDEAKRLSRPRTSENERGPEGGLDCRALGRRGEESVCRHSFTDGSPTVYSEGVTCASHRGNRVEIGSIH